MSECEKLAAIDVIRAKVKAQHGKAVESLGDHQANEALFDFTSSLIDQMRSPYERRLAFEKLQQCFRSRNG